MFSPSKPAHAVAIRPLTPAQWEAYAPTLPAYSQRWAKLNGFNAKAGQICLLPDSKGSLAQILVGCDVTEGVRWAVADLPHRLPGGTYWLDTDWPEAEQQQAAIGWGLGSYRFQRFRKVEHDKAQPLLYVPASQWQRTLAFVDAVALVRDLINQPANHMMPEDLAQAARAVAATCAADYAEVVGDELLQKGYPTIHAVGRASRHPPRLIELHWGDPSHPKVALVGKGVCFDTGGLDIKPAEYMRLMKKDMGGAAHVLGLAQLVMQLRLPIRLHVLIPAVENAIGGDAFRPGDVLATRSGKNVEVDNTDAEGRLVLCDALTAAVEQQPELILDFATLTGAARVALGTEIPAFFSNHPALTAALQAVSQQAQELIWNLPLHQPYMEQLKSKVADILNSGGSYGGAITAALFLNEFIPPNIPWAHFDVMAWNTRERPGRPVGGEAMGLFAAFTYLENTYLNQG